MLSDGSMQVVNAILGASLMMVGGALAFRYRLSDRARCSIFCRCLCSPT